MKEIAFAPALHARPPRVPAERSSSGPTHTTLPCRVCLHGFASGPCPLDAPNPSFHHPALPLLLRRTPRRKTTTARCAARPPRYEQTTAGCAAAGDGRVTRCGAQLPRRVRWPGSSHTVRVGGGVRLNLNRPHPQVSSYIVSLLSFVRLQLPGIRQCFPSAASPRDEKVGRDPLCFTTLGP